MKLLKAIAPLLMANILATSFPAFAGEKVDESLNAENVAHINIENLRGDIKIIGWNKDTVSVKGELDDLAERLIFERSGNSIKVKVEMPNRTNSGWQDKGTQLTIKMPQGVAVDFNGVSSNVSIENTQGVADINTVSGDIDARDLIDHVTLSSVSGNIKSIDVSGKVAISAVSGDIDDVNSSGRIKLKAISGNIETKSSATEVVINTVSGDAEIELSKVDELNISTVSGDVDSRLSLNENGVVKMSSVSGSFDVVFQKSVAASFRLASNAGGDFVNRITSDKAKRAKYGPSSKLNFETGNASGSVKGSTVSGTIKLSAK